ncbi:hypothetical protein SGLAM104S_08172 [Streptomyces glaucescens]
MAGRAGEDLQRGRLRAAWGFPSRWGGLSGGARGGGAVRSVCGCAWSAYRRGGSCAGVGRGWWGRESEEVRSRRPCPFPSHGLRPVDPIRAPLLRPHQGSAARPWRGSVLGGRWGLLRPSPTWGAAGPGGAETCPEALGVRPWALPTGVLGFCSRNSPGHARSSVAGAVPLSPAGLWPHSTRPAVRRRALRLRLMARQGLRPDRQALRPSKLADGCAADAARCTPDEPWGSCPVPGARPWAPPTAPGATTPSYPQ